MLFCNQKFFLASLVLLFISSTCCINILLAASNNNNNNNNDGDDVDDAHLRRRQEEMNRRRQQRRGGGGSHDQQQQQKQQSYLSADHELVDALQRNAPPGVRVEGTNFMLPALVTHLVEFELVKSWRTVLVENATATGTTVGTVDGTSEKNTEPLLRPVANLTHWEVMGSVVVAMYGEAEPKLVQEFLRRTVAAYGGKKNKRTMSDGFTGVHPVSLSQHLGGVTYVPVDALPPKLRAFGEELSAAGSAAEDAAQQKQKDDETSPPPPLPLSAIRPPWAQKADSRWLMSTAQRPALAHFSFFDGYQNSSSSSSNWDEIFTEDDKATLEFQGDADLKQHLEVRRSESGNKKPELLFRLGSLVHRECTPTRTAPRRGKQDPFSWYMIGARTAPQLLRTEELLHQAERNKTHSSDELRERVRKIHDECAGDRIFGQVVSGFPHVRRLVQLPHHLPLFSREHYTRRRQRFSTQQKKKSTSPAAPEKQESRSSSSSSSTENNDDDSVVFDTESDDQELLFFDDHHEQYFSPFLEGVPMQHVSISRATVSPFRGIDDYVHQRLRGGPDQKGSTRSHAVSPPAIQRILDEYASNEKLKQRRLKELDEANRPEWAKYRFGRVVSAFDLDSDVRHARADVTMSCLREQKGALAEFEQLQDAAWAEQQEDQGKEGAEGGAESKQRSSASRLQHLLDAVSEKTRRFLNKNKVSNSHSSSSSASTTNGDSLFERFVRFTGGAPIGPNVTLLSETWSWADKTHHDLLQQVLLDRVARHPSLRAHKEESQRVLRKRKLDDLRKQSEKLSFLRGGGRKKNIPRMEEEEDRREFAATGRVDPARKLERRHARMKRERDYEIERLRELKHRGFLTPGEMQEEINEVHADFEHKRRHGEKNAAASKKQQQQQQQRGQDGYSSSQEEEERTISEG